MPTVSQRLNLLPGFSPGNKPFHLVPASLRLEKVNHVDETGKVVVIKRMLGKLQADLKQ